MFTPTRIAATAAAVLLCTVSVAAQGQTVTPNDIKVRKGQSITVTVATNDACAALMTSTFVDGEPNIVRVNPPAALETMSQDFTIEGLKAGTTQVRFLLIGPDALEEGGGPCEQFEEVILTVRVQDPAATAKKYATAAKVHLSVVKTTLKTASSGATATMKQLMADLKLGTTDPLTAINDATAAIMSALATMDDTVRTKLQDIVTDGTAILATEEYEQTTMPTQMLAGGRGAHDRIVTGLQKDWSKTYGSIAKGWAKFVQTVESTAISNGNPVDVASVMSRPRFPAVNSPTTEDVTPTSIAPESPQMLMWVAMAPDGQLVVMGLAAPDADGDFDLLLDGPNGFANRLNVNPVSSAGVWNEIYDLSTPGPGSYTLSLVEASENVPFQVLAASCPASP